MIEIYTDGACIPNPGCGGYAAVLLYNDHEKIVCGHVEQTTNNRMELMAVTEALKQLTRACQLTIYTDSNYVKLGITKWIFTWQKNAWRTSDKQAVKNKDLWVELDALVKQHDIKWVWVKGHSGNFYNEKVDSIADLCARGQYASDIT